MYKVIGADGQEYGPVSADTLRQWIAQGRASAATKVRPENETEWQTLGSLPEFGGDSAVAPPTPHTASGPTATSGLAISSLVLGILGLFSCGATALIGLILGIIGLNKIKKSEGRLSGSGLAIAGIVVSGIFLLMLPLFAAMLLPALAKAKAKAQAITCLNNARQVTLGILLYADANTNLCPNAVTWCDDVLAEVGSEQTFRCGATPTEERSHFAYNANLSGVDLGEVSDPATTVLIIESDGGWNSSGSNNLMRIVPRHARKIVVGFADGHAEMLTEAQLPGLKWEP